MPLLEERKRLDPQIPLYTNIPERLAEPGARPLPTGPRTNRFSNVGTFNAGERVRGDADRLSTYAPLPLREATERGRFTGLTGEQYNALRASAFTKRARAERGTGRAIRQEEEKTLSWARAQAGTPEAQRAVAQNRLARFATKARSISAPYTSFTVSPETGETITTTPDWAKRLTMKYEGLAMVDPEGAAKKLETEFKVSKSYMAKWLTSENRAKVRTHYAEMGRGLSEEQRSRLDEQMALLEEDTPEAASAIRSALGEMEMTEVERIREEGKAMAERAPTEGVRRIDTEPTPLAESWEGSLLGRTYRELKRGQAEAVRGRRYISPY